MTRWTDSFSDFTITGSTVPVRNTLGWMPIEWLVQNIVFEVIHSDGRLEWNTEWRVARKQKVPTNQFSKIFLYWAGLLTFIAFLFNIFYLILPFHRVVDFLHYLWQKNVQQCKTSWHYYFNFKMTSQLRI